MLIDRTKYEDLRTSRIFRNFRKSYTFCMGFVLGLILSRDRVTSVDTEIISDVHTGGSGLRGSTGVHLCADYLP